MVRSALISILTDSKFSEESDRWKVAKKQVEDLTQETDDKKLSEFDDFAVKVMQLLGKHCNAALTGISRSKSVLKEKAWIAFHHLRISELPKLWSKFTPNLSPLVCQHVNYKLYTELVKSKLCQSAPLRYTRVEVPELNEDEENIIRYAAGYVPFKLLKKYEKSSETEFVECLSNMSINGDESNLMEYTRMWTMQVNRGGLFEINDLTYTLFKEIEVKVRYHLFTVFHSKSSENRAEIIQSVASSDDVQFYWTILSVDIPVENHAIRLLEEIIGLWVNIRGFSIAGGWLEQYKHFTKVNTAKSKALRKDLKRKREAASTTSTSDD